MPLRQRVGGHINLPLVRPFVCPSGYRCMVCPAISSYSFGATALIFCRMFIHIMEVCMSTGFWWSGGGIICVLQTHFIFKKSHISPQKYHFPQIIFMYIFRMLLIQVHILICTKKKLVLQLVAGWAIFGPNWLDYKSNYLSFWEYLKKIKILWTCTPPLCI